MADGPSTPYDFSSAQPTWLAVHHPQTVEQIIAHGYLAVPSPIEDMATISDKGHTSWLGLDDVITQIRQRYDIYHQNADELTQSICEANNSVHRQVADQGMPANQRQQYSADKAVRDVYEQKRTERVNLWRDVSRVRSTLPEVAQQYLGAYRKLSILSDTSGQRGDVL